MKKLTYKLHKALGWCFLVVYVVAGADYLFEWGYFGGYAKGVVPLLGLVFIVYAMRLAPTKQDELEYGNQNQDELTFVPLLEQIAKRWPKGLPNERMGQRDDTRVATAPSLQPFLAEDFDAGDLLNPVGSIARIETIDRTDATATFRFYDSEGTLQRAEFRLLKPGEWKLKALKFQCPVCFGSGRNDGAACAGCGGNGWGVK